MIRVLCLIAAALAVAATASGARADTVGERHLVAQQPTAALRDAEKTITNETTKGALGRLIKKLEAAK